MAISIYGHIPVENIHEFVLKKAQLKGISGCPERHKRQGFRCEIPFHKGTFLKRLRAAENFGGFRRFMLLSRWLLV